MPTAWIVVQVRPYRAAGTTRGSGLRRSAERQRSGMLFDVVTCRETRSSRPSPVFLNTILLRTTVKRWPRERASTLRLGARYALEPAAEPIF